LITSITFDDISPAYLSTPELDWLINVVNQLEIKCTFFVVVKSSSIKEEFAACLRSCLKNGHELALHGYRHVKNEFGYFYPVPMPFIPLPPFSRQKEYIEQAIMAFTRLTGVRPLGFRAPFYLHNDLTMKVLSNLDFKYDSSKTVFKPAHGRRFRVRWSRCCKPYKIQGIIEIPVTGDYTYNLKEENFYDSLKGALRDFEWAKYHDCAFVMNIHTYRLEKSLLRSFLQKLVSKLFEKTDFVRLVDVNL
jgi:peptidoglycan/xylan/chitin deacetylase (PgdA/CDA1 family)